MLPPSSRHLSHDFKAYKELTLYELFICVLLSTFNVAFFFFLIGLASGLKVALTSLGLFVGFIIGIYVLPKPISRLKLGKPYGYLRKKITLVLVKLRFIKSPFLTYVGRWQKSKYIRRLDV